MATYRVEFMQWASRRIEARDAKDAIEKIRRTYDVMDHPCIVHSAENVDIPLEPKPRTAA